MKRNHIYSIVAAIAVLFSACADELQVKPGNADEEVPVQLTLSMPNEQRAITVPEESQVDHVDVLAFYYDGTNMRFNYKATNIRITPSGANLQITALVQGSTAQQQFVVLANASAELAAITILKGELLADVVEKIVCTAGAGEYPANVNGTGAAFKKIPRYAKTSSQVVTEATGNLGTFPMLRMVARVNVKLKSTVTNFELKCAALYNYKKAGYVAYDFSSFNGTDKVAAAAVPTVNYHSGTPIVEPTVWHNAVSNVINNSIFTYESPAFTEAQRLTGTALVIGGYYAGNTSKLVYYRIDIKTSDPLSGSNISHPILRNHSYEVEVQSVAGPGADTGLEAYIGKAQVKVFISVLPWTNVDINGDPLGRTLSVSALEKDLTGGTERVYFNSNQPTVTLDANGLNSGGSSVTVASFLDAPATTNFHYTYNATTKMGEGYIDLTVASTATAGTYRIYINANGLKREVKVIIPPYVPITPYVGAFWRHDQTGERAIKIKMGGHPDNLGAWTATVQWMDSQWSAGDIVLAVGGSSDPNIYKDQSGLTPGNAESYQVPGTLTTITGTAAPGDSILFRIGLKSKFTTYNEDTNPARYAVVFLSYNNNTKHQKLYLRQGEGAENMISGGFRWNPYNVREATNSTSPTLLSTSNRPVFTEYPTQGGCSFMWSLSTAIPVTTSVAEWSAVPFTVSSPYDTATDPCRMIAGGLYKTPSPAVTTVGAWGLPNMQEAWRGYYADGWFDRRAIVPSIIGVPNSTAGAGVTSGYIGLVFVGTGDKSVFFPFAGGFHDSNGLPHTTGANGVYLSDKLSTVGSNHRLLIIRQGLCEETYTKRIQACALRCIRQ